jgi:hypothetical protein
MANLDDIIAAASAAYAAHEAEVITRITKRNALLVAIHDLIVAAVAAEMPEDLRQYLDFSGDKTGHIYTDQPIALALAIPDIAPINIVVDARSGVDVAVKVGGIAYPSLAAAIGAAKAQAG